MTAHANEPTLRPASAADWELPGNRGWHFFRGRLLGLLERAPEPTYLAELQVRGDFWSTAEAIDTPDILPDFSVCLHQVELPRGQIAVAVAALEEWLATHAPVDVELSVGQKARSLRFSLLAEAETISSTDHPVFRLRMLTEAFAGEAHFVVDQSCVRLWANGLKAWLAVAAV